MYWAGPIIGAISAGFMYEFVFATNSSVNKGVCFLQSSRYNPDDKTHLLPLIKTKCRCAEKCLDECTRIKVYENYLRQTKRLNKPNRNAEKTTSYQNYNVVLNQCRQDMGDPSTSLTSEHMSNQYDIINEHLCLEHRSISDWRMLTSSDGGMTSSLGDNISLDQSICEERVSSM